MISSFKKLPFYKKIGIIFLIISFLFVYVGVFFYPVFRFLFWIVDGFELFDKISYKTIVLLSLSVPVTFPLFISLFMKVSIPHTWIFLNIITDYMILCIDLIPFAVLLELIFSISNEAAQYSHYLSIIIISLIMLYMIFANLNGLYIEEKTFTVKFDFFIIYFQI